MPSCSFFRSLFCCFGHGEDDKCSDNQSKVEKEKGYVLRETTYTKRNINIDNGYNNPQTLRIHTHVKDECSITSGPTSSRVQDDRSITSGPTSSRVQDDRSITSEPTSSCVHDDRFRPTIPSSHKELSYSTVKPKTKTVSIYDSDSDPDEENAVIEFRRQGSLEYEKLYRLLREGENTKYGIQAKNPSSNVDVVNHVARGSRGQASKYISTCANLYSAHNLLSLKKRSTYRYGTHQIVEIDVRKLPYSVTIIDLTSHGKRQRHIQYHHDSNTVYKFNRYADQFDEILLVGDVPAHCIRNVN